MVKQTALTEQDLRLYMSQRNTDTPDGGGKMTATVLTGAANELFPPISDVDLINGRVNARLVYGGVLKPVPAALWGSHMVVSEPPKASNVSFLMFASDHYGQERQAAMARVEAYAVPASRSRMTLLNTQLKGSRIITAYQRYEYPLPLVGERYCLQYTDNTGQKVYDYFRVVKISSEVRTYVDANGEFQRRFIKLETQDPLARDYEGLPDAVRGYAEPDVLILETQIADSGRYYGVRPLAAAGTAGDASLQVDTIFEKLVPTSTVETAHTDDFSGGKPLWIPTSPRRQVAQAGTVTGSLYLDSPVLPGSVELAGWTDDATGVLKRGASVLQIDYEKGVVSGLKNLNVGTVYAVPAARFYNHAYAATVEIDQTNLGTEYVLTLRPKPAKGSASVLFRSGRAWYRLDDAGDGFLRDSQGVRRGVVTAAGTVSVSLPVVPDDGSKLMCYWSPAEFYRAYGGGEAGTAIQAQNVSTTHTALPPIPKPMLKPSTVRLTWNDGATRNASDNHSFLSGDCGGYLLYAAGELQPTRLSAASVGLTAEQYIAAPERKTVPVTDGEVMTFTVGSQIQAGSLSVYLPYGLQDIYHTRSQAKPVVHQAPAAPKRNYPLATSG
ncbi:hypothetical protein [Conchiformibius steedae]|uniref:hypothetical protein n=1 Tax=Conchiformibius steedae TaxID=153493 RepID=UPI0026E9484D|nr:hypothetical protein [Conchiformibius steedae]